jgi:hypothetical protein
LTTKKTQSASSLKRKARNSIYTIFSKLYPKLHLLFCYYEGTKFEFIDPRIERILGIKDSDKPGNRRKNMGKTPGESEEETVIDENAEEELEKKDLPKEIKQGLQLMYTLNLAQLRREFDKTGLFETVSENDKVLNTYILFYEFDKEYSFILTTNKIKYNVGFDKTGKYDYRTRLNDLYDHMRTGVEGFKNYIDILQDYEKLRKEKPTDNTQYMEHTKRLETLNKKKIQAGKSVLSVVRDMMEKISEPLSELVHDMDNEQEYIENPQDVIEFETHIEGVKKIHGKKIYDAIHTVYNYVSAFSYRLGGDGDLSGNREVKETQAKRIPPLVNLQKKKKNQNHSQTSQYSMSLMICYSLLFLIASILLSSIASLESLNVLSRYGSDL